MSQPDPDAGIKRQDTTFSAVVRRLSLMKRYGGAMLRRLRKNNEAGRVQAEVQELETINEASARSIPDVDNWEAIVKLVRNAGRKYVFVLFYLPGVWSIFDVKTDKTEQFVPTEWPPV